MKYTRTTRDVWVVKGNPMQLGWSSFGPNPAHESEAEAIEYMEEQKKKEPRIEFKIIKKRVPLGEPHCSVPEKMPVDPWNPKEVP